MKIDYLNKKQKENVIKFLKPNKIDINNYKYKSNIYFVKNIECLKIIYINLIKIVGYALHRNHQRNNVFMTK